MSRLFAPSLSVFALLLVPACSDDPTVFPCTPGTVAACTCTDGSASETVCDAQGAYGLCDCATAGDVGADVPTTDASAADAGPDVAEGVSEAFFGTFECEYTTKTFAGEWSPEDTTTETITISAVDGGFALSSEPEETPFGDCEVVFDLDGVTATFREPQPCTDGIMTYQSGSAIVVDDRASIDVLGTAFGYTVSSQVDCGAGEVPPDWLETDRPGGGFLGPWNCDGTVGFGEQELPATFELTNAREGEAGLVSTFTTESADPFVGQILPECIINWNETGETTAVLGEGSYCPVTEGAVVSETGLQIVDDTLVGSFAVTSGDGGLGPAFEFQCER